MSTSALTLRLPREDGSVAQHTVGSPAVFGAASTPPRSRRLLAAAHVVADPLADAAEGAGAVDWEGTLAYRRHLWSNGLGVAEAMDTAQRGAGLNVTATMELIRRSGEAAAEAGGRLVCGANTDALPPDGARSEADIIRAYLDQAHVIEGVGAEVVVMASRHLAPGPPDAARYRRVYGAVLQELDRPAILHWLGPMFDPHLEGYWGASDLGRAADVFAGIVHEHAARIEGVKVSLLDAHMETLLRRRLPAGVRMYTGDDFHYSDLILGDEKGHSDALLGIFDPIAPAAAAAVRLLDEGDVAGYRRVLEPTVPLARHVFREPTRFYKTGIVFLAYLNGHQDHFRMVGGQETKRSVVHLSRLFALADQAGLLRDPPSAVDRMRAFLRLAGVA